MSFAHLHEWRTVPAGRAAEENHKMSQRWQASISLHRYATMSP
jgi:hypothetical protein